MRASEPENTAEGNVTKLSMQFFLPIFRQAGPCRAIPFPKSSGPFGKLTERCPMFGQETSASRNGGGEVYRGESCLLRRGCLRRVGENQDFLTGAAIASNLRSQLLDFLFSSSHDRPAVPSCCASLGSRERFSICRISSPDTPGSWRKPVSLCVEGLMRRLVFYNIRTTFISMRIHSDL